MIKIYHNPRCRKSREGLELLEKSGEKFEIVKYLEDVPSVDELKEIINYLGIPATDLVRKSEAIWKENYKGKTLTEDEVIETMVQHPRLIERPIVIKGTRAVIGRPAENIRSLF